MILSIRFSLVSVSLVCFGLPTLQAEPLRVVSYNVENLFHPKHDTVAGVEKDDLEWTPEGERRWSYTRYYRKVEQIARVLTNIGEMSGVDLIGLQEVENALCVKRLCRALPHQEYDFIHYESPDRRGIDVALLYRKTRIDTLQTRVLPVDLGEQTTRDILYACVVANRQDTLHLLVCHLPSQRGGEAASQWKREAAKRVIQTAVDSILTVSPQAQIIVMGDMNSAPKNDLRGLDNRMMDKAMRLSRKGTHKYQGRWTCLDQFYTSPNLDYRSQVRIYDAEWIQETDEKYMGLRPKRTYNGVRYENGFSDHLPIIIDINENRLCIHNK